MVESLYRARVGSGDLRNHLQCEWFELVFKAIDVILGKPPPDASLRAIYPFQGVLGSISRALRVMARLEGPQVAGST